MHVRDGHCKNLEPQRIAMVTAEMCNHRTQMASSGRASDRKPGNIQVEFLSL
jgi:hypothetical protein